MISYKTVELGDNRKSKIKMSKIQGLNKKMNLLKRKKNLISYLFCKVIAFIWIQVSTRLLAELTSLILEQVSIGQILKGLPSTGFK